MNSFRHILSPSSGLAPRGSWLESSLAGLPHFLFGLYGGLDSLLKVIGIDASFAFVQIILNTLFALASLTSLILFLRLGRTRWIAAWYLYWIMAGFYLIARFLPGIPPWLEPYYWIIRPIVLTLLFLCIGYLLYRIAARDRLRGILTAVPAMLGLWIMNIVLFSPALKAISCLASSLLAALICIFAVRLNRPGPGLAMVMGMIALAGITITFLGIYLSGTLPYSEPVPSFPAVWNFFTPLFGATAALAIGPQLAVTLRALGQRSLPAGKPAYRLALAGLLLSLAVVIFVAINSRLDVIIQIIFLSGMLIYVVGYLWLVLAMRRDPRAFSNPLLELLLFVTLSGVPLVLTGVFPSLGLDLILLGWILDGTHLSEDLWRQFAVHLSFLWVLFSISSAIAWMKQLRRE